MSLKMKWNHPKLNVTQIGKLLYIECHSKWNVTKMKCHLKWNVIPIAISLKWNVTQNGMSLKIEFHSKFNGTQN